MPSQHGVGRKVEGKTDEIDTEQFLDVVVF